jgi:hypothetical protein
VSIVIKKEESPIVVPLHISADEAIKREERSPLPSLQYPSTSHSRASSQLSSYRTCLPALCFSPIKRGNSLDSTYHLATPIRSPTPLEQPIDWEPARQHGAVTDTTLIPSSASSRTCINPIGHIVRRVFVPSEVSDIIREGLQLGAQQRADEEQLTELWQRVHEARTRVEERLNREERVPPRHPPFPNLVPYRWFRGAPPRPFLHNRIAPLRPREHLRLSTCFHQDYAHH